MSIYVILCHFLYRFPLFSLPFPSFSPLFATFFLLFPFQSDSDDSSDELSLSAPAMKQLNLAAPPQLAALLGSPTAARLVRAALPCPDFETLRLRLAGSPAAVRALDGFARGMERYRHVDDVLVACEEASERMEKAMRPLLDKEKGKKEGEGK